MTARADPHRGGVIVSPEYRRLGCLPADQFVPQLMQHLGEPCYVALLSAAELHGAAHQRPQSFHVMVKTNCRAIECGEVRVQFVARKDMERTPAIEKQTPRGLLRVAATFCSVVKWRRERLELDIGLLAAGCVPRRSDRHVPAEATHTHDFFELVQ
jgi:hypothetical protein